MKNLLLVLIALICFAEMANAQQSELVGSWLMTKAEVGGEIQNPYFVTEFNENGKMIVMGMDAGTWHYSIASNAIVMKSELDKDFNGEGKIINLTEKELVVDKDGAKLFYRKVDVPEITESNKNSGLMGMWEFKDIPYSDANTLVTFTEPDEFRIIQKEEGMTSNLSGTWIFDKQKMSLIMIGLRGEDTFNGENKVVKVGEENLELENNGKVFKAQRKTQKKAQETTEVEHLTFDQEEFYTEVGDYKYAADKEKLPWTNWSEMKKGLLNIKQLVYSYDAKDEGAEAFENQTLTASVIANLEDEGFIIDHIFRGYISTGNGEERPNTDYNNPLYPLEDNYYRIVGNEQITTPAGTFDCTVVEVAVTYDLKKKLWLINDKIGVYAKIIDENTEEDYGYYHLYELQEIK